MKILDDLLATDLLWTQPTRRTPAYELRDGDNILVQIRWKNNHSGTATVRTQAGEWTIDRKGWLRPRVTIHSASTGTELALFQSSWDGGGALTFRDGRTYAWNNTNAWHTAWLWTDRSERPLLRFKGKRMTIEPAGRIVPEVLLLAALSWYLTVMSKRSSDAGAAAAIVSTLAAS